MVTSRKFRFEVVREVENGRRTLVSRHHERHRADRRLLRLPLKPGEIVAIIEDGNVVRASRSMIPQDHPEIPF